MVPDPSDGLHDGKPRIERTTGCRKAGFEIASFAKSEANLAKFQEEQDLDFATVDSIGETWWGSWITSMFADSLDERERSMRLAAGIVVEKRCPNAPESSAAREADTKSFDASVAVSKRDGLEAGESAFVDLIDIRGGESGDRRDLFGAEAVAVAEEQDDGVDRIGVPERGEVAVGERERLAGGNGPVRRHAPLPRQSGKRTCF